MNQQFLTAPAFNQTERHNKNHNEINEKTPKTTLNIRTLFCMYNVWLAA